MALDPDLILHIGHSKTGSTSIQKTLANAREWLLERQILYPETAFMGHNHRALVPGILRKASPGLQLRMGTTPDEVEQSCRVEWNSVHTQFSQERPEKVILSAEEFFEEIGLRESARLKNLLQVITRRPPRILAYIRSPAAFYISRAQQNLRGGRGLLEPAPLRRKAVISSYEHCFSTKVELHPFERSQLTQGDAVADFAAWIGMAELSTEFSVLEANQSLSSEAMSALHRLGPSAPLADEAELKAQRRLVRAVRQADAALANPTKPRLRPHVTEFINAANSDFLDLREEYGLTFEDIDYTALSSKPAPDLSVSSIEDICTFDRDRRDALERLVTEDTADTFLTRLKEGVRLRRRPERGT